MKWSFLAVDHVDVPCPRACEAGFHRVIGKAHREDEQRFCVGEPSEYDLDTRGQAQLRAFFAKALRAGELLPADPETARAFGVTFTPAAATAAQETSS